ncbi:MAG: AlpA family phage regulatory protein [Rhodoferax sp.]|nr:AlpA family phage regulatory protein [Rhodoferax sp.]
MRLPAVLELTGRGRTAWLDDVKAGKAPKPIKIGAASMWLHTEVQGWIAERIRESRGA